MTMGWSILPRPQRPPRRSFPALPAHAPRICLGANEFQWLFLRFFVYFCVFFALVFIFSVPAHFSCTSTSTWHLLLSSSLCCEHVPKAKHRKCGRSQARNTKYKNFLHTKVGNYYGRRVCAIVIILHKLGQDQITQLPRAG